MGMTQHIKHIFEHFDSQSPMLSFSELVSGHINDTYLIKTAEKPDYVLQRINHRVFKDVPGLVNNKVLISKHLRKKSKGKTRRDLQRSILQFVPLKGQNIYYYKEGEHYWNMMVYIENSRTFDVVTNPKIAFEGGKLFGDFLNQTQDFDSSRLIDVIPRFHDMAFRFEQFEESLQDAAPKRLEESKLEIDKIWALKEEMHIIQKLKESGAIRTRVTHNDTKISNALFDLDNKGLCVIDTDTVMPGIVHYDFGDAIRTICNTAAEDEQDLTKVRFNYDFYEAYQAGFLGEMNQALTPIERKYLPLAAKTMTFIMAIRFLTDFLNGDIYYKTAYANHNLVRSKNQLKLIDSMTDAFAQALNG